VRAPPCKRRDFARILALTVRPSAHSENAMKIAWLVASAAVALVVSNPALARKRHHVAVPPQCRDQPYAFSWWGVLTNGAPQPNGCAPAVYEYGSYIGQDPDPNIRSQLRRDPASGYSPGQFQ
jgi:hypothetical protein